MDTQPKKLSSEYHIDGQDRLIYVDDTWREFANNNAAPELVSDTILFKPLWNFIADRKVHHLYQMLLEKVRQSGKPVQIFYRCDAPHMRRFMEMRMTLDEESGVQFRNWLVREEPCEPVELLDTTAKRSQELLIICSWCKRVKVETQTWVQVEEAVQQLALFEAAELPQLSHGICPECFETWLPKS